MNSLRRYLVLALLFVPMLFVISGWANGPPLALVASRSTYGKIWYDDFSSDTRSSYATYAVSSWSVTNGRLYIVGTGYDPWNFQQDGYHVVYNTDPGTQYVFEVDINCYEPNGDAWFGFQWNTQSHPNLWDNNKLGYKIGSTSEQPVYGRQKGTGWTQAGYSYYTVGWNTWYTLKISKTGAGGFSVGVGPTGGSFAGAGSFSWSDWFWTSGRVGVCGKSTKIYVDNFKVYSGNSIRFNNIPRGYVVRVKDAAEVTVTYGTSTGGPLDLGIWGANSRPPYRRIEIYSSDILVYNSEMSGQFVGDIWGGDVYSFTFPTTTVESATTGTSVLSTTVLIPVVADSNVGGGTLDAPGTNPFGAGALDKITFGVPSYTSIARGLIKFDDISKYVPPGATITSADLLYNAYPQHYGIDSYCRFYRITSNWVEQTVNWDTKPSYDSSSYQTISGLVNYVRMWHSGTPNHGLWMEKDPASDYHVIYSKDSSYPPRLRVTFVAPVPLPTGYVVLTPIASSTTTEVYVADTLAQTATHLTIVTHIISVSSTTNTWQATRTTTITTTSFVTVTTTTETTLAPAPPLFTPSMMPSFTQIATEALLCE